MPETDRPPAGILVNNKLNQVNRLQLSKLLFKKNVRATARTFFYFADW